jgi:hypothetical protein
MQLRRSLVGAQDFFHLRLHRFIHLNQRRPGAFEAFAGNFLRRVNAEFAAAGDFARRMVKDAGGNLPMLKKRRSWTVALVRPWSFHTPDNFFRVACIR